MASIINATTSTGLVSSADNSGSLQLATNNGTTAVTIDTSQNVGIGLTSPTSKLTVRTADGDGVSIQNAAGTAYRWAVNADNSFSCVNTGVAERMQITSAGLLQFNSGYGSVATAYGCRAWVNFNGTGTVAIRASGNVSSITDNGTGDYTVNFSNAMPDANYATAAFAAQESASTDNNVTIVGQKGTISSNYTASICRLQCIRRDGNIGDLDIVTAVFF